MLTFSKFNLLPGLLATLKEKGLKTPTEIQAATLSPLLEGRSIVGVAETGSGKTLAYALPILHTLKTLENNKDPVSKAASPRALVMVPTRELGEQVSRVFKPFTHTTRLRVRTVLGGTEMAVAKRNIASELEILIATPGRMLQLLSQGLLDLSDVRTLVFDEADQMLDQGFLNDVTRIAKACPRDRQMALFSATMNEDVQALIASLFAHAEVFRSKGAHRLVETLNTVNRNIPDGKRFPVLQKILSTPSSGGTLIFANTREQCDKIIDELKKSGFECALYRGEMDKIERRGNLKKFREGKIPLLVSTDLASRGIDVEHISRVINYHLPQELENYVHRVGRTARAGRSGQVINFVTDRDAPLMKQVESIQKQTPKKQRK